MLRYDVSNCVKKNYRQWVEEPNEFQFHKKV